MVGQTHRPPYEGETYANNLEMEVSNGILHLKQQDKAPTGEVGLLALNPTYKEPKRRKEITMIDSKLKELSRETFAASASTSSIKTCEEYVLSQLVKAQRDNEELLSLCASQKKIIRKQSEILRGFCVELGYSGEYWVIKWIMTPDAKFNIVISDGLVLTDSWGDELFKRVLDHLGLKLPKESSGTEASSKESSDEDKQGFSETL